MDVQSVMLSQRRKGTAVWKQIEQALMKEFLSGEIAPGDRLPSEAALAERFSVNRHTIRRTLAELAAQDVVRVENGRGAFVREDFVNYKLSASSRFWEILLRDGQSPSVDIIDSGETPASPIVAQALRIAPGEPTIFLDSLGSPNGQPVVLARHSFVAKRFPGLIARYHEKGSIQEALISFGVRTKRHVVRVSARLPDEEEATAFQKPWPQPVLHVESIYIDEDGAPVDHGVARYSSARIQLDIEL